MAACAVPECVGGEFYRQQQRTFGSVGVCRQTTGGVPEDCPAKQHESADPQKAQFRMETVNRYKTCEGEPSKIERQFVRQAPVLIILVNQDAVGNAGFPPFCIRLCNQPVRLQVRAAVDAGSQAASQNGELVSAHVIPRPEETVLEAFLGR